MDIVEFYFAMLITLPMHLATFFYAFCGIIGQFVMDMLITLATLLY